jgi:magnesium transporter
MPIDSNKILVDSVKRLLRRGAISHLTKIVNKTHGADLSVLFRSLSRDQQRRLFDMITDVEQKGILFSELEEDIFQDLIEDMPVEAIVEILESMPADDVADIIGRLPEDRSQDILDKMKKAESEEVEDLLQLR